jgi:hypothetical protein
LGSEANCVLKNKNAVLEEEITLSELGILGTDKTKIQDSILILICIMPVFNHRFSPIFRPTTHIMYITSQPIQPAKVVLQELSAPWKTYAKIVLAEHGQKMPQLDAALTDNMKHSTHSAKTAQQESI